ncbi:hypothetical protein D9757_014837 [Collybiopsis confluens]|uniref:Uncharacterized protein n=1 Tax=Collybiopsis confluens TaxID=2823264 RepID=A0A8H5CDJ8_9AGAR|nr:hypothetical protein D9757_015424 [Collybiopsis confluens]KAF5352010.1 hypothetical protein D9757_014837 [Collybiopsis confluens]
MNTVRHPMVVQAQNKVFYYHDQRDKKLTKYPVLLKFEQRTQIPKTYAVLDASLLVVILHMYNLSLLPSPTLLAEPYLSFKAVESPSSQDDVQWSIYWVIFGFFNFMERPLLFVSFSTMFHGRFNSHISEEYKPPISPS